METLTSLEESKLPSNIHDLQKSSESIDEASAQKQVCLRETILPFNSNFNKDVCLNDN